ncbi:spindle pole body-associated protein sad1 [Colletotrichum asianum]
MPPRRRPSRADEDSPPIRTGPAVTQNLPSMPSRFDTSYGSAPSTMPRNSRRGQVRNIQVALEDALNDDDDSDDGGPRRARRPSVPPRPNRRQQPEPEQDSESESESEPEPEPGCQSEPDNEPDFDPGFDAASNSPASRHSSPPRQSPPRRASSVDPAEFQPAAHRGGRDQRILPTSAPLRGPNLPPPVRAGSEEPRGNSPLRRSPRRSSIVPPETVGSAFHRAIEEVRDRAGSEDPTATPESNRTFGQESSLFGDATIGSRSPGSIDDRPMPTIEEEDSLLEAEDYRVAAAMSPSRPVLPRPRNNPPMPPTSFNQQEPSREPSRSPLARVSDGPAPDHRLRPNPFAAAPSLQPPQTPRQGSVPGQRRSSPPPHPPSHSPPRPNQETRVPALQTRVNARVEAVTTEQHGLFGNGMAERVGQEQQRDFEEQQRLRRERATRLQTWPKIYAPIYTWTNTARPDRPSPVDDDPRDPLDDEQDESSRQIPRDQMGWHAWIMFTLADAFVEVLSFLMSPEAWLIKAALAGLASCFLAWAFYAGISSFPAGGLGGIHWYGLSDISHNLGQFVPLWVAAPSTIFSDRDTREHSRQQREHDYAIRDLTLASDLQKRSIDRLEQIVPKVVHMTLDKDGRPIVGQGFWFALRDMMKADKEVLTLGTAKGGYHFISDEHWRAIRDKLKKDPDYQKATNPPDPGVSASDVDNIFQNKLSKSWEGWLRSNNEKVAKILEPAFGTSIPDKIEKDLDQKIEKYVKDLNKDKGITDIVVTRKEFIGHLNNELTTHRAEVRAEAEELKKNLEQYIAQSVDLAMSKAPPSGVSRTEMIHIVDDMIRQAIANAGLEALAKGTIGANWNQELSRQVNYLTVGSGSIVDIKHTSPNYKPEFVGPIGSPAWLKSTRRSPWVLQPAKTQTRWDDDGECWCGRPTVSKNGKHLGVFISYLLSHEIVPRHVVVEHILPGATLNPDARPQDIEIWAYISEINMRQRVEDFSASHFPEPDTASRKKWLSDGWVKIGQFTYESNDTINGIYVHQLSPELVKLGASTDHITIRAVNNYGADHTCIYRARLFGERLV